ncbi:MAG TPA: TonB family protein [Bryobacteraceae bacterium]|nr:TonB family protein [Bryobacteraceae bacterium]
MELLLSVSLRVLIPAAIAGAVLGIGQVKAAAARHAAWTAVTVCMLLYLALAPVLPSIPVRVLPAASVMANGPGAVVVDTAPAVPMPAVVVAQSVPSWHVMLAFVYGAGALISLLRLAYGYAFTRRLLREARPVDGEICESSWISVPMTVGWLRPKILLPPTWRDWDETKLEVVLAHERCHVRRADWAIAGVAAINRSLFWFHPLAWWLERILGSLAEHAADDAALLETVSRAQYAEVLLDMAAAVSSSRGRTVWEAMAMAKTTEVHMRIDRILDETRQIPAGLSRPWCAVLLACSLPVAYAAAVLEVAPAVALAQPMTQEKTVAPPASQPEPTAPTPSYTAQSAPKTDQVVEQYIVAQRSRATSPSAAPPNSVATQTSVTDQTSAPGAVALAALTPVTRVSPEYPRLARETGAHGMVELIATVAKDGHVTDVKVIHGPPMLQRAAVSAVMQWTYPPQPAETQTLATVDFPGSDSPAPSAAGIQQAVLISKRDPVYPEEARRAGTKGIVELVVTIASDGHVKTARTLRGDPLLAKAAEDAVLQWRYKPTLLNGTAVESQSQVFVNFAGQPPLATPPSSAPPAGAFEPAALIFRKEPIHPGGDLQGLGGTVIFQARVGMDGRLSNIRVTDGPAELVPAALEAVKQWVYRPARVDGQAIETDTQIELRFTAGR